MCSVSLGSLNNPPRRAHHSTSIGFSKMKWCARIHRLVRVRIGLEPGADGSKCILLSIDHGTITFERIGGSFKKYWKITAGDGRVHQLGLIESDRKITLKCMRQKQKESILERNLSVDVFAPVYCDSERALFTLDTIKKQTECFAGKRIWVSQKSSSPGWVRQMCSAVCMHCVLAVVSIETTS